MLACFRKSTRQRRHYHGSAQHGGNALRELPSIQSVFLHGCLLGNHNVYGRDYPPARAFAQASSHTGCTGRGIRYVRESAIGGNDMSSVQPSSAQPTPSSQPKASSQPTPERIFEVLNGYQQSAAMKAAIELDVFHGCGKGRKGSCGISPRSHGGRGGYPLPRCFPGGGWIHQKAGGKNGF